MIAGGGRIVDGDGDPVATVDIAIASGDALRLGGVSARVICLASWVPRADSCTAAKRYRYSIPVLSVPAVGPLTLSRLFVNADMPVEQSGAMGGSKAVSASSNHRRFTVFLRTPAMV